MASIPGGGGEQVSQIYDKQWVTPFLFRSLSFCVTAPVLVDQRIHDLRVREGAHIAETIVFAGGDLSEDRPSVV